MDHRINISEIATSTKRMDVSGYFKTTNKIRNQLNDDIMNRLKFLLLFFITCKLTSVEAQNKILFVTSNQEFYGNTKISASNHFEEIVVPYDIFIKAGYSVDFVSPKGGAIPVGYINTSDSIQKIYNKNGVVSTICHGTAGIAYLKDENGKSLYAGKKITGFPDKLEKKEMEYYKAFPFAMDKAIKNNDGNFVYSEKGKDGFYVVDGRFVTGQDPSSASKVANEIIAILKTNFSDPSKTMVKSDFEQITEILLDYIEGTANGQPERLRKAFHPNFNLYTVAKDTLWTRSGEQYISNIKVGEKSNRIGRIISIDIEKDAAVAKAEIEIPGWRTFTDYFLILKYQGAWKIVHKSYTWRELPKTEDK
jgi:putative intracellular protease/amidase